MNLNKVQIIGRVTRDPELKALPSGAKVATFGMATNRIWFGEDKEKHEDVEFHNMLSWGKQAETLAQYLKKGSLFYVEGRLQTRSWEDEGSGKKMYRTEIVIEHFQFAPKAQGSSGDSEGRSSRGSAPRRTSAKKSHDEVDTVEYPADDIDPSDIPF